MLSFLYGDPILWQADRMSTIRGARERARVEVTAAIKDEARKQLAEEGAAKLSLRAVARELGMASSALYRYFPSRDDLLTALIVDAYDAIGAVAERAGADRADTVPPVERWTAVACAVREWGLAHPHEYALIFGSPVPGYTAPMDTVGPASRVGMVFIGIARAASEANSPCPRSRRSCAATPSGWPPSSPRACRLPPSRLWWPPGPRCSA